MSGDLAELSLMRLRSARAQIDAATDAAVRWDCDPSLATGVYVLEPAKEALRHLQAVVDEIKAAHAARS